METLDDLVVGAVFNYVLARDRLKVLLREWLDRSEVARSSRREQLKQLRTRLTMRDGESANVIKLVRAGVCQADDPQIATELGNIAAQTHATTLGIEALERQLVDGELKITPDVLEKFGALMADKLRNSDKRARRDNIRLLVNHVEVGQQEIRITGSKPVLFRAASGVPPHMVPKAERGWRTRHSESRHSNYWEILVGKVA